MIVIKTPDEIEKMAKAGKIVAEILENLKAFVKPGITTKEIEMFAEEKIISKGGTPAFKGYRGYPASICTSVNNQVIHGIPSRVRLNEGDVLSIDLGVYRDGFYGDGAVTMPVGEVNPLAKKLLKVTEEALYKGIDKATPRNRVSDISYAIENYVEANGFSIVKAFVGHGIGMSLHEEPQVPNFGVSGQGPRLREGMTIAIEPMVNTGGHEVSILDDGWTAVTLDGGLSAHFEHTIAITDGDARILTKV
ncbi:MAG: type I methionyl aminopeptidase [Nitrospirae bacterium RBG_16_43_8]|nr:MAG: type I methionyl aminopeptidase [Nitrospirae bacterium RBG_16_43_8]